MEPVVQSPKKTYYSISEVCSLTGLEPHVLRYWESEFPQLRPKKNRAGNRAYRDKDIEIIEYIKRLLYEEKYTIPGARKKLSESKELDIKELENGHAVQESLPLSVPTLAPQSLEPQAQDISWVVDELKDILNSLKEKK